MKKLAYSILFLSVMAISFQSCDSDDDNGNSPNLTNQMSVDGTVYSLDGGIGTLESYGENAGGSFDWDVEIESNNIGFYFDLNTNSANGLVAGTYTYAEERAEFTFVDSDIFVNSENYYSSDGTVVIAISGDTTTISFNLTSTNGTPISGQWSGVLSIVED